MLGGGGGGGIRHVTFQIVLNNGFRFPTTLDVMMGRGGGGGGGGGL